MQDILAIKFDINLVKTRNKYFTKRKWRGAWSKQRILDGFRIHVPICLQIFFKNTYNIWRKNSKILVLLFIDVIIINSPLLRRLKSFLQAWLIMQVDHYWCMALYGSVGRWCVPVMTEVSGIFWHLHLIIWWLGPHGSEWPGSLVIHTCITAVRDTDCHIQTPSSVSSGKNIRSSMERKSFIFISIQLFLFNGCKSQFADLNWLDWTQPGFNCVMQILTTKTLISLSVQPPVYFTYRNPSIKSSNFGASKD